MALHFVGFREGSQLYRAMQLFGIPDFIHVTKDARFLYGGELDPSDAVVYAQGDENTPIKDFTVDDSGNFHCHYRKLTGQIPW